MDYLAIIQELMPNMEVKNHRVVNFGADSLAVMVNSEYIFRFPIKNDYSKTYMEEKKILDKIRPYIKSTKIPKLKVYVKGDKALSCHRIIRGDVYMNIKNPSNALKRNLSKSIAKFCQELHSIDMELIDSVSLKQFDPDYYEISGKEDILKSILGYDPSRDIEKSINYLNNYTNFDPNDNALCHDDLHEENILIKKGNLSGIIDFPNIKKQKLDTDFANLLSFDAELTFMIIDEYEKLTNRKIDIKYIYNLQKIRCYGLLAWFVKGNNQKYIELFKKFVGNLNRIDIIY
jgi:aminoglycoside phosphotransferase (APT) family kinase protein